MLGLVVQQRTPDCTFNYTALLQCASTCVATLSVHCTLYSQPEYMQVEHLSGRVEHHLVLLCICCTAFLPKPSILHCVAIMHLGRSSVRKLQAVREDRLQVLCEARDFIPRWVGCAMIRYSPEVQYHQA